MKYELRAAWVHSVWRKSPVHVSKAQQWKSLGVRKFHTFRWTLQFCRKVNDFLDILVQNQQGPGMSSERTPEHPHALHGVRNLGKWGFSARTQRIPPGVQLTFPLPNR